MPCLQRQGAGGREGLGEKTGAQSRLCLSRSLLPGIGPAPIPAGKALLGIQAGLRHKILII